MRVHVLQDQRYRRALFPQNQTSTSTSRTREVHSTSSFYNRISVNDSPDHWQPGEYINTGVAQNQTQDLHSLLSSMQSSINAHLSKIDGTLSTLNTRLEKLEEGVAVNSAKLNSQPTCSTPQTTPTSSSCESSGGGIGSKHRKRRLPTGLSVSAQSLN